MTSRARQILEEALTLPEEERLFLVEALKESFEPVEPQEEVDAAWRDEINRRLKSIEDGTAVLHEWQDVKRELLDLVKK
ncbi:MAG: addiction module protein [Deltaproteobacteria bacterium]|nr:addiction module protein [Deltaproteobacteria bacterium]